MLSRMSEELTAWIFIADRVHHLIAETVRTHPDVEARAALRNALIVLEELGERMKVAEVRAIFAELDADGPRP